MLRCVASLQRQLGTRYKARTSSLLFSSRPLHCTSVLYRTSPSMDSPVCTSSPAAQATSTSTIPVNSVQATTKTSHRPRSLNEATGGLSIMSWNVDMSERVTQNGNPRRMPRTARVREIVKFIITTSPDVVCLQDSSPELAAALTTGNNASPSPHRGFQLVASSRNGAAGWLQTFIATTTKIPPSSPLSERSSSTISSGELTHWTAVSEPQYAFCTVSLVPTSSNRSSASKTAQRIRLANIDLTFKGKGLSAAPTTTSSSSRSSKNDQTHGIASRDGLNESSFPKKPPSVVSSDTDPRRALAVRHLVDVVQPDIVVGSCFMGSSETLYQPLYRDAWAAAGADPDHELTVNTFPIFAPPSPLTTAIGEEGLGGVVTAAAAPPPHEDGNETTKAAQLLPLAPGYLTNYFYFAHPKCSKATKRGPTAAARRQAARDGGVRLSMWSPPLSLKQTDSSPTGSDSSKISESTTTEETQPRFHTTHLGRYQRSFLRKARHHQDIVPRRWQHSSSFAVLQPWCMWEGLPMCPAEQFPTLLMLA